MKKDFTRSLPHWDFCRRTFFSTNAAELKDVLAVTYWKEGDLNVSMSDIPDNWIVMQST